MFKKLLFVVFLIPIFAFSQKKSEVKGYLIKSDGQKIEGTFLVSDFNLVEDLQFKSLEGNSFQEIDSGVITEFGTSQGIKYVKREALIAVTSKVFTPTDESKFQLQTAFFNVMVEGPASLYFLAGHNIFFYSINNGSLKQLLNTHYVDPFNNTTVFTHNYRKQLYTDVFCDYSMTDAYSKIQYNKKSLISLITKYNLCKGQTSILYEDYKSSSTTFEFSAIGGYSSVNTNISTNLKDKINNSQGSINVGVEAAMLFNKGKYEIYFSSKVGKLSSESISVISESGPYSPDVYNVINFDAVYLSNNLGFRFSVYKNKKTNVYVDASMVVEFLLSDDLSLTNYHNGAVTYQNEMTLKNKSNAFFEGGVGYMFNNKYAVDLKYGITREYRAQSHANYTFELSNFGLNLRYRF